MNAFTGGSGGGLVTLHLSYGIRFFAINGLNARVDVAVLVLVLPNQQIHFRPFHVPSFPSACAILVGTPMADPTHFTALAEIVARARDHSETGRESSIKAALDQLFGLRYTQRSRPKDAYRDAYALVQGDGVPYAGIIAPDNPPSGAYGGASLAWFPCDEGSLVTLVVGTKGLAPDEGLLTRPGHRRRVAALRHYLAAMKVVSWAKSDPAAIMSGIPKAVSQRFDGCAGVFERYGDVIYSASWVPKGDAQIAQLVL
jgi:hypothetical protein